MRPRTGVIEAREHCGAARHDDLTAVTHYGCVCPKAVEARREYERGRKRAWTTKPRGSRRHAPPAFDDLAVELAAAGHHLALTPVERAAAVARLDRYDLKDWQRAERLGVSRRTILRHRAALRAQQAA